MKILNITIQDRDNILDTSWLDGQVSGQQSDLKKFPVSCFSLVFKNEKYYLIKNEKSDVIKDKHSFDLDKYKISFTHEEHNHHEKPVFPFASFSGKSNFNTNNVFFTSPTETTSADKRLNFLYSGLPSAHRENFLISETSPQLYSFFHKTANLLEASSRTQKKDEKLFHLPVQMIQNALSVFKKGRD